MAKIVVSALARLDLQGHFDYLAEINYDKALEFFDAARQTFADLARRPSIGSPYRGRQDRFQNLRRWPVKGFKRYLIFYRPQIESIEIVRVLYGTQDIEALLGRSP